jgi:hypothetical protein
MEIRKEKVDGLQDSAGSGSDGHDASAGGSCPVDFLCRIRWQIIVLAVHHMVVDLFRLHGSEGTEPDVEREVDDSDADAHEMGGHLLGEVETGRRGCRRPVVPCIDGLISRDVVQFFVDIGRQRDGTDHIEHGLPDTVETKANDPVAIFEHVQDLRVQNEATGGIRKLEHVTGTGAAPGLGEYFPVIPLEATKKKKFDASPGIHLAADQSSREDTGVVADKAVSWPKERWQVGKREMDRFA